ncbi:MAG: hypothetical protein JEZ07_12500 [Phycisphaerae bacterium]|nr:hypothetical protein [Phycisphaerae bacterium]
MARKYIKQPITKDIQNKLMEHFVQDEAGNWFIELGNYTLDFSRKYKFIKFTNSSIIAEHDGRKVLIKVELCDDGYKKDYIVYADSRNFQEIINY